MSSRSDPMATSAPSDEQAYWVEAFKLGMQRVKIKSSRKADTWVMESLAANNMTDNWDLLDDVVPVSNQVVARGIGEGLQVRGIGSVFAEHVVLPNVRYVPGLGMNLVSVDQLTTDHDLKIEMAGTRCLVTKMSDGTVVGRAHLTSDNKYEVDSLRIRQN